MYVKTTAGARTAPHGDGAVIVIVTVDDNTTAIIAMTTLLEMPKKVNVVCEPSFLGSVNLSIFP